MGEVKEHGLDGCDALLRASASFDPFRCKPRLWTCECGRVWEHVCDESEGCFYAPVMLDSETAEAGGSR